MSSTLKVSDFTVDILLRTSNNATCDIINLFVRSHLVSLLMSLSSTPCVSAPRSTRSFFSVVVYLRGPPQRDWRANAKHAAQYGELMFDACIHIFASPSAYFDVVTMRRAKRTGSSVHGVCICLRINGLMKVCQRQQPVCACIMHARGERWQKY